TSLSLYGYRVDAVIANRVFPQGGDDEWRAGWVAAQKTQLEDVEQSFAPLPVFRAAYHGAEPVGLAALADFGATTYVDANPFAPPSELPLVEVDRDGEEFVLSIT